VKRTRSGDAVDVDYRLLHEGTEVKPDEYDAFRELLLGLADARNARLVLRAKEDES
jgi:hypothetical protein